MTVVLLGLLGLLIGGGCAFLPFPVNLSVPFSLLTVLLMVKAPWCLIFFLLGITPFRILWGAGGIAPQELAYSLTFLFFLAFSFFQRFIRSQGREMDWDPEIALPIGGMGLIGLFSTVVALFRGHPFAHWASDLNFILFFWFYFVVSASLRSLRELRRVLWMAGGTTAGVVLWGVYKRISERQLFAGITPGFAHGMAFSSSFFTISLCLFLFSEGRSLRKKRLFLATLFFGLHQLLSFVRVNWVSHLGAVGFIFLLAPSEKRGRLLRWIGSFLLIGAILVSVSLVLPSESSVIKMPTHWFDRLLSIFRDVSGSGLTVQTRYSEWGAALKTYAEHPFFGNGLGTEIQFIRYDFEKHPLTTERYIHSSFIYYLLNTGPFGLLVFLWFCIRSVRYGIRVVGEAPPSLRGLALAFTASFVFQIFSSIAGNELNNPARTIWTGFFLGALTCIRRESKRIQET